MSTFYSFSFGCRVNQAEKEELDRQLVSRGYRFQEEAPDLYIINSCSVTNKAEREAKQLIYQVKKRSPHTKVIVTGCAATNWLKTKTEIPEIDLLVDNQNKEYLAELIQKRYAGLKAASRDSSATPQNDTIADKFLRSKRMVLKTQDGCQRFCTYCIVPYLRGLPKSIPASQIVAAIQQHGSAMHEAILSSINTEAYGYDTKETFIDLVKAVLEQTEVRRISFGSIHPWSINEEFFKFYTTHPQAERIVNFFHIPLQSGSNKMLQLMKRGYTREEFLDKLQILGSLRPHTFIGTDVIVGFLEETDADFQDTYDFLERTPISKFHVFRFSKRQHTAAFHLAKRLTEPTPDEKHARAKALAELSTRKYHTFLETHVGHTFEALFLEKTINGAREALLSNQVPVLVGGKTTTGDLKQVKITEYKNGKLWGKVT